MKQSSLFSYVKRNGNNCKGVDSIEQEAPLFKRNKCNKTAIVKKWDEGYFQYGFFLPDDQILNVTFRLECLVRCRRLPNFALVPVKLQRDLEANRAKCETDHLIL